MENNAKPVKKIALTHDYFYSNDGYNFYASPRDKYRLKLTGVNEVGNTADSVLRYKMQYEEQFKLPPRMNCGIDWWGYYNGHPENQQLVSLDDFGRQYTFVDRDLGYTTTSAIGPSNAGGDVANSGNQINYVFSRSNGVVYIYNNSGVIATVPQKYFVTPKK